MIISLEWLCREFAQRCQLPQESDGEIMTPTKSALEALDKKIYECESASNNAALSGREYPFIDGKLTVYREWKKALTANTWRDIKDAPRDGTRVLIWDKNMGASRIMFWAYGEEEDGDCWFVDSSHGQYAYRALPELTKSGDLTKWQPITKPEQPPC